MSFLRVILLSSIGLSTLTVCFVSADRLAHAPVATAPAFTVARRLAPEPVVTGTVQEAVTQGAEEPAPTPRALKGFDTERLNALLRSAALPGETRRR